MRGVAFLLLFGLVACATGDAVTPASASSELRGWQTAAGKPPSKNEFAAVVAACEDRAKNSTNSSRSRAATQITACVALSKRTGLGRVPDITISTPACPSEQRGR